MPIVQLHKDGAEAVIDSYQTHMKPAAYELVFDSDSPEILNLIKKVRNIGSNLFINSLWPELCGGHDDDRAVELHQPDESWGWIIGQGAKLIQTDRPALLLECPAGSPFIRIKRSSEIGSRFPGGLYTLPIILSGVIAAIIWNLFTWWKGIPSSSSHTLTFQLGWALCLPVVAIILNYLAFRAIYKDEVMVKAADRLRR